MNVEVCSCRSLERTFTFPYVAPQLPTNITSSVSPFFITAIPLVNIFPAVLRSSLFTTASCTKATTFLAISLSQLFLQHRNLLQPFHRASHTRLSEIYSFRPYLLHRYDDLSWACMLAGESSASTKQLARSGLPSFDLRRRDWLCRHERLRYTESVVLYRINRAVAHIFRLYTTDTWHSCFAYRRSTARLQQTDWYSRNSIGLEDITFGATLSCSKCKCSS